MSRWRTAIVIVHYRTPTVLVDCLRSLACEVDATRDCVVVVDNASGPEHLAPLREFAATAPWLTLLESATNGGFAAGNNFAIEYLRQAGGADNLVLLNPDTLVRQGALEILRRYLEVHPEASIVGPRLEGVDGTPQLSAFGPMSPMSELIRGANIGIVSRALRRFEVYGDRHEESHETAWLSGACMMMEWEVVEKTGLLDARYFLYFEEVDFCRRARKLGFRCWYVPAARIVHLEGQSSGVRGDWSARRVPAYWFESRHRYFRKHFGYLGMIAADLLWFAGHLLMQTRRFVTGVSHSPVAPSETRDLLRHSMRELVRSG